MKRFFMISLIICLAILMMASCGKNKDIEENDGNLSYYVNPDGNTCTVTGIGDFEGNSLVIDTIDGYAVTKIEARAFFGCESIKRVTIGDSVTHIEELAFGNCINLESVELPDEMKTVGKSLFYGCKSLVSVEIPSTLEDISDGMFAGCSGLVEMSIPNGVKRIGKLAFSECTSLNKVEIPPSVSEVGWYAFDGCAALRGVYISDIAAWCNIDFLTDTTNPLYYAKKLYLNDKLVRELAFSSQINSSAKKIGDRAFINCKDISFVIVGSGDIKSIGAYAFAGSGIIDAAFFDAIEFIAVGAFDNCDELERISYDGTMSQWKNIYYGGDLSAKIVCVDDSIDTDVLPDDIPEKLNGLDVRELGDGTYEIKGIGTCTDTHINILNEHGLIVGIGYQAFLNNSDIVEVNLGEGIRSIRESFAGCSKLESITLPKSLNIITYGAFASCKSLKFVYYNGTKTDWNNITKGNDCFEDNNLVLVCTNGKFLIDDNGNIIDNAPENPPVNPPVSGEYSKGLEYIYIANSNEYKVSGIGNCLDKYLIISSKYYDSDVIGINDYAFFNNLDINGVRFEEGIEYIGQSAFNNCYAITEIVFPESVLAINEDAFRGCAGIRQIVIPGKTDVQKHAFTSCKQVISVEMQNVVSVDQSAFSSCHNLISVKLGPSLENIGQSAFSGSDKLESIYYDGTYEMWEKIVKGKNCFMPSYADGYNPVLICNDGMYSIDYNGEILEKIEPDQDIYSKGFTYKKNEDGETCTITGLGSCKDTELVIGGSIDGYKITAIADNAFKSRISLTSLVISDGIVSIGKSAFESCTGLVSVEIPDTVDEMGAYVFRGCSSLKNAKLSSSMQSIPKYAFENCKDIERISIPQGVMSIDVNAFDKCTYLEYVYIPASVVEIADSAFARCLAIKTVEFGGEMDEWHSIKKMGNFNGGVDLTIECSDGDITIRSNFVYQTSSSGGLAIYGLGSSNSQNNITIPAEYNGKVVDEIAALAFNGKLNIVSVVIPDTVTKIGDKAFSYCSRLQSVEFQGSSCVLGNDIFEGCKSLSSISFYGTRQEWNSLQKSGDWGPSRMIMVNCSDGVIIYNDNGIDITESSNTQNELTYDISGGSPVVSGITDSSIPNVIIYDFHIDGDGAVSEVQAIANSAFENNTQIKTVIITKSIEKIGDSAFAGCENLETVVLQSKDISIGMLAFHNCTNFKQIVFYGTVSEWNNISKGMRWRDKTGLLIVECIDGQVKYIVQ